MTDLLTARLRTGRHNPQALYAQAGDEPARSDPSVGWARSARIARHAVEAVNEGRRIPGGQWHSLAGVIYTQPVVDGVPRFTSAWIIAVDSEDLAARIADAANGQVPDA